MGTVYDRVKEMLARAGIAEVPRAPVIGVVGVALCGVVLVGVRSMSPPDGVVVEAASSSMSDAQPRGPGLKPSLEESGAPEVCVHVVGAVTRPGMYVVKADSRVADAVDLAGGLLGNAAEHGVNLARQVSDGEQIYVPTHDELDAGLVAPTPGVSATDISGGLVDLNSADTTLLETLPGIGPTTAERIVADREENGPYVRPEDLMRVSGIGDKKYEALADLIVVK